MKFSFQPQVNQFQEEGQFQEETELQKTIETIFVSVLHQLEDSGPQHGLNCKN